MRSCSRKNESFDKVAVVLKLGWVVVLRDETNVFQGHGIQTGESFSISNQF